eukprot:6585707-Heterocapsa_arctica.AAC.1
MAPRPSQTAAALTPPPAGSVITQGVTGAYHLPDVLDGEVANDGTGRRYGGEAPDVLWEYLRTFLP